MQGSAMTGAVLTATSVEARYEERLVLGPLDLEIGGGRPGTGPVSRTFVLIGPNGAGKTTLLKLLCGVLVPSGGRIEWRGTDFRRLGRRELARRIAYVPQVRPASVPLTVRQMILLGRHPHFGRWQLAPRTSDYRAVESAIELSGLSGLEDRVVDRLSGGERQAVYVAAALAQEAELLVLDEPTTHLDPSHRLQVASLLERLGRPDRRTDGEMARTLVLATHDLDLAAHVADHVVALKAGRILESGPAAEVLRPELLTRLFDAPFEVATGGTDGSGGGSGRRVHLDYRASSVSDRVGSGPVRTDR